MGRWTIIVAGEELATVFARSSSRVAVCRPGCESWRPRPPAILADRLFQDQPLRLVYVSPVLRTEQVLPASLFVVDVAFRIRLGSPSSLLLCTYHRFLDGFHCVCVCVRAFAKELCSETPAPSLLQEG